MSTPTKASRNGATMPSVEDTIQVFSHTVAYRYSGINVPLTDEVREDLKAEAESRAKELIAQEFVEGELNCLIGEHQIRGWWEIQR